MITDTLRERVAPELLPLFARFSFAATLLVFFWRSALTKLGDGVAGLWTPSLNAYAQVLPAKFEAAGYDVSAMSVLDQLIVVAGTWGEFILPVLIVLGLFTRLASLGMLGFLAVMTWVDIFGHGVQPGVWFDGDPKGIIADLRVYWVLALLVLLCHGAGRVSVDHLLTKWRGKHN